MGLDQEDSRQGRSLYDLDKMGKGLDLEMIRTKTKTKTNLNMTLS
jgi:hypothetical protein